MIDIQNNFYLSDRFRWIILLRRVGKKIISLRVCWGTERSDGIYFVEKCSGSNKDPRE